MHVIEPVVNGSDGVPKLYANPYAWNRWVAVPPLTLTSYPLEWSMAVLHCPTPIFFGCRGGCREVNLLRVLCVSGKNARGY